MASTAKSTRRYKRYRSSGKYDKPSWMKRTSGALLALPLAIAMTAAAAGMATAEFFLKPRQKSRAIEPEVLSVVETHEDASRSRNLPLRIAVGAAAGFASFAFTYAVRRNGFQLTVPANFYTADVIACTVMTAFGACVATPPIAQEFKKTALGIAAFASFVVGGACAEGAIDYEYLKPINERLRIEAAQREQLPENRAIAEWVRKIEAQPSAPSPRLGD